MGLSLKDWFSHIIKMTPSFPKAFLFLVVLGLRRIYLKECPIILWLSRHVQFSCLHFIAMDLLCENKELLYSAQSLKQEDLGLVIGNNILTVFLLCNLLDDWSLCCFPGLFLSSVESEELQLTFNNSTCTIFNGYRKIIWTSYFLKPTLCLFFWLVVKANIEFSRTLH